MMICLGQQFDAPSIDQLLERLERLAQGCEVGGGVGAQGA